MSTKKILISFVLGASITVFESAAEEKSAYDDIPEFGGPGSVGVDLKEENKPAPTGDFIKDLMPGWFETKERVMNDHGLGYGINYSTLYQKANNSVGEDQAWGGILQLPASWTVMNNKDKGSSGTFVFKLENRHKIATDLAPQDLGLGTFGPDGIAGLGAVSIVGTQFSDKGWILTNLYWQHKMRDGKLNYVVGQIDNTDFLDLYGLLVYERGIVTGVTGQHTLVKLHGPGNNIIQEISVMGNEHKATIASHQIVFQPFNGLDIQVRCGLVQKEQVCILGLDQNTGKHDLGGLPPA